MSKIYINDNAPEYRGASQPKFNKKLINPTEFGDGERAKELDVWFDTETNEAVCIWMAQDSTMPSDEFLAEVARAFKANGAPVGTEILVKYGIRDDGWEPTDKYFVTVN